MMHKHSQTPSLPFTTVLGPAWLVEIKSIQWNMWVWHQRLQPCPRKHLDSAFPMFSVVSGQRRYHVGLFGERSHIWHNDGWRTGLHCLLFFWQFTSMEPRLLFLISGGTLGFSWGNSEIRDVPNLIGADHIIFKGSESVEKIQITDLSWTTV